MKKLVALWDLGNVVVRWEPETILTNFNCTAAETDFLRRELLGHDDWLRLDQGLITEQQFAERICAISSMSMAKVLGCFDVVRASLIDIPESVKLIRQMHDAQIPMYVLSNMSQENADMLKQREYFQCFDGVMISAEEKLIKPDPALFERVLNKYALNAGDLYFIDDSQPNIDTARSLGFKARQFHRSSDCYRQIRKEFGLPG